jgi:hypothetical protein
MAVLGTSSLRGRSIASDSSATAGAVLEHFVTSQTEGARWPEETIEIEASLTSDPARRTNARLKETNLNFWGAAALDYAR